VSADFQPGFIQLVNKTACYHQGNGSRENIGNPMKPISLLAMLALVACATNTPDTTAGTKATGSIAGAVQSPIKAVPAMRICALNAETRAATCIKTASGQSKYRIENLPAADYRIVAGIEQGQYKLGGHMLQVQCIRAPCPAMLKTVSLTSGQVLDNIDLNGFYEARDDFPVLPAEKK